MKAVYSFIVFYFLFIFVLSAQVRDTIMTIRNPSYNAIIYDMVQVGENQILFQHTDNLNSFNNRFLTFYRYDYVTEGLEEFNIDVSSFPFERIEPLKIVEHNDKDNTVLTLNKGYQRDTGFIFLTKINLADQQAEVLGKVAYILNGGNDNIYITNLSYCNNAYYSLFNLFDNSGGVYGLIKITDGEDIVVVSDINVTLEDTTFISQGKILDMICASENRFILGGDKPILALVDSSLNKIDQQRIELKAPDKNDKIKYWITDHFFAKDVEGNIRLSGVGFDYIKNEANAFIDYSFRVGLDNGSLLFEDLIIFSGFDDRNIDHYSSITYNNHNQSFYTAVNELQREIKYPDKITTDNLNTKEEFYLRKITNNQEAWTRTYGGDANYNIVNLRALDNGYIVIFGHVYNYYGERTTNGFFTIVNEEGELITSNIDIKALDKQVNVYPNPANDWITIDSPEKLTQLRSFDNQGRLLREDIQLQNNQLDISAWPAGIYYLQLFYGGEMVSKRLVKM